MVFRYGKRGYDRMEELNLLIDPNDIVEYIKMMESSDKEYIKVEYEIGRRAANPIIWLSIRKTFVGDRDYYRGTDIKYTYKFILEYCGRLYDLHTRVRYKHLIEDEKNPKEVAKRLCDRINNAALLSIASGTILKAYTV